MLPATFYEVTSDWGSSAVPTYYTSQLNSWKITNIVHDELLRMVHMKRTIYLKRFGTEPRQSSLLEFALLAISSRMLCPLCRRLNAAPNQHHRSSVIVEARWSPILVRVVLVGTLAIDVVFIIHLLRALLGMLVSLMTIPRIFTLGLGQLVNFPTHKASKKLFGECVGDGLALRLNKRGSS